MDKQVKVIIISTKTSSLLYPNKYDVRFDDTPVDWNFFSLRIEELIQHFTSSYFYANKEEIKFEYELSKCFCSLANNILQREYFVIGDINSCSLTYFSKRKKHCNLIFPQNIDRTIFLRNIQKEIKFYQITTIWKQLIEVYNQI